MIFETSKVDNLGLTTIIYSSNNEKVTTLDGANIAFHEVIMAPGRSYMLVARSVDLRVGCQYERELCHTVAKITQYINDDLICRAFDMEGVCGSQRDRISEVGPFSFMGRVRITNAPEGLR